MKPSVACLLLLVLLVLLDTRATGIRLLEEKSMTAPHNKVQEKSLLVEKGGGVGKECGTQEHCPGTSGRVLMNAAEIKNNKETGSDSARGSLHHSKRDVGSSRQDLHVQPPLPPTASNPPETYPDVMDIAGMDYSPAKRRPPIHN